MNSRDDVLSFLEDSGFDDFTIIRYIYLYVCNLFTYDVRFHYADHKFKTQIYNKRIDITNVQDYEIACYTYAHVLVDLLSLYGIEAEIVRDVDYEFQHAYVIVRHKGKVLKLDPTKKHDTTRVKMQSPTLDFQTLIDDSIFYDQLVDADMQIYDKKQNKNDYSVLYNSETINELISVINRNAKARRITDAELFYEKIYAIEGLINTRTDFSRYDDIDYYFGYLIKKFRLNDSGPNVKPAVFFKNDDPDMKDIINLAIIEYENFPPIFYIIEKVGNNYKMREISINEMREKLNEYDNWKIGDYFRNKIDMFLGKRTSLW